MEFISRPEARPHVIFLSDYDMILTEHLVKESICGSILREGPGKHAEQAG